MWKTEFKTSIEKWDVVGWKASNKAPRVYVDKIATRNYLGQFAGCTNYRGTVDKVHESV